MQDENCRGRIKLIDTPGFKDEKTVNEVKNTIKTYIDILTKHRIPVEETTAKLLTQKLKELNFNNEKL